MFAHSFKRLAQVLAAAWLVSLVAACATDEGFAGITSDPEGKAADERASLPAETASAASRCAVTPTNVACSSHTLSLSAASLRRDVHYELPIGPPPPGGFPVAIFFQGSFLPAATAFNSSIDSPFGLYNLSLTVKALLDDGYAVLAPNALLAGTTAWQTNIPPYALLWSLSADDAFVRAILRALSDGQFGPVNSQRLYAMGISSGGFMTSRMAVSYRGKFRALAINSGSYAICSALCVVPTPLPSDHPPTLFLHGGSDLIVPVGTMKLYRDELQREGHVVDSIIDEHSGHEWLPEGPQAIVDWFDSHP